ncbi:MAG: hypothetical protein JSW09_07075, partial [Pseudomonadota bacterium]
GLVQDALHGLITDQWRVVPNVDQPRILFHCVSSRRPIRARDPATACSGVCVLTTMHEPNSNAAGVVGRGTRSMNQ